MGEHDRKVRRGYRCIGKEEGKGMLYSEDKMKERRYKNTDN